MNCRTMTKKIQQIKDEVAIELGYKSNSVFSAHEQLLNGDSYKVISNSIDQIAIRYAQEQKRELLEMLKNILASEHLKGTIEESKVKQLIKSATEG